VPGASTFNTHLRDNLNVLTRVLAQSSITSDSAAISGTSEGAATTIIGPTSSVTFDGVTPAKIEAWFPGVDTNNAGENGFITFFEDAAVIGRARILLNNTTKTMSAWYGMVSQRVPSAAGHTYTVKGHVSAGNMTIQAGAGGSGVDLPAVLRVMVDG
jgi:hypothetical protein